MTGQYNAANQGCAISSTAQMLEQYAYSIENTANEGGALCTCVPACL